MYITNRNGTKDASVSTEGLVTLGVEHHEIHEGKHFFVQNYYSIDGLGTEKEFILVTPNTSTLAHMLLNVETEAEFTVDFYRFPSFSSVGTPLNIINNNDNSSITPTLIAGEDPTLSTDGTLMFSKILGSGNKIGGLGRQTNEIVLRKNTSYLLRFTKNAAGTDWIDLNMFWYEEKEDNL